VVVEHDNEKDLAWAGDRAMSDFLKDAPFKGSKRVYLIIKIAVLVLAALLALRFLFGVV
jgi:hypothetical protein